jgi:hypothetical protein
VLIDRRQTSWSIATVAIGIVAVAIYFWLDRGTPGGLTGGSTVGLWYGVAGSALMIYAGLLSTHRLFPGVWWLGMRKTWLRGHLWLGSLSVILIACHAHGDLGGPLEVALWAVLAAIILTGVYGLVLQQVLPGMLARRFPDEAPYGQIPHLCRQFRVEADELVDEVAPAEAAKAGEGVQRFATELRAFHTEQIRPFLAAPVPRRAILLNDLSAESMFSALRRRLGSRGDDTASAKLDRLEELCRDRRRLAEQEHMYRWLHAWLFVHVPLSAALLVLGSVHAVVALRNYY